MRRWPFSRRARFGTLVGILVAAAPLRADIGPPPALRAVRIEEHLGDPLPLDLTVTATDGRQRSLKSFFDGHRPVLLTLFYTRCPMLCGLVLNGASHAMAGAHQRLDADYRALSLSIDPHEQPADVAARRTELLRVVPNAPADAWPFVVSDEASIRRLTAALGFAYQYDPATRQFAHPAAMFVLTGDGRISRYLYGFDPSPDDLDEALTAAAAGRVGQGGVQQFLLQCYRYVPSLRRHAGAVRALLVVAGILILGAVALCIGVSLRSRRRAEAGQ